MKKLVYSLIGLGAGVLNGLFGAGGGVVVVPFLKKTGLEAKKAHATSVAIIIALSVVSVAIQLFAGGLDLGKAWIYLPGGLAGGLLGAVFLKKINNAWLTRIFGVIMVISGGKLLFF